MFSAGGGVAPAQSRNMEDRMIASYTRVPNPSTGRKVYRPVVLDNGRPEIIEDVECRRAVDAKQAAQDEIDRRALQKQEEAEQKLRDADQAMSEEKMVSWG